MKKTKTFSFNFLLQGLCLSLNQDHLTVVTQIQVFLNFLMSLLNDFRLLKYTTSQLVYIQVQN